MGTDTDRDDLMYCHTCGEPIHGDLNAVLWRDDAGEFYCSLSCRAYRVPPGTSYPAIPPPALPPDGKATNPKDALGSGKLPLHLWPETATALGCLGFMDGALKYGRGNFRAIGVRASIYADAAKRHINAWFEGEEADPDSGLPHLAHALACLAILVDAEAADMLTDDRNVAGGYRKLVTDLTPHVARLKERHKDKAPKHYTIEDNLDLER